MSIFTPRFVLAAVAATCLYATAGQAHMPAVCADRDTVIERLSTRYGETRQSIGLSVNNSMMEVFASEETGSWTITLTRPNGQTCMIASGAAFERLNEGLLVPPGKGV